MSDELLDLCELLEKNSSITQVSPEKRELEKLHQELAKLKQELEKTKKELIKCKIYNQEMPLGILQELSNSQYEKEYQDSIWKHSPLQSLDRLKNDCSGRVGELFIETICKKECISHIYNCDINSKDGTYDIIIRDKKIEIKTAKLGKQKSFQHESIRQDGYDYLLFLDITPELFYITIIPKFDLKEKSDILGKKAHLRKGTTDVYKLDLTENHLFRIMKKGYTLQVDENTSLDKIVSFFQEKIL